MFTFVIGLFLVSLWILGKNFQSRPFQVLKGHKDAVQSIAFSPDNQFLASGSLDCTIKIWRVSNANLILTLGGEEIGSVNSVAFSPDGQFLASGGSDQTIKLWRVSNGRLVQTLECTEGITCVAFSPNGRFLASAGWNGIKLWQIPDSRVIWQWSTPGWFWYKFFSILMPSKNWTREPISPCCLTFSPEGTLLAAGFRDGNLKIWQVP